MATPQQYSVVPSLGIVEGRAVAFMLSSIAEELATDVDEPHVTVVFKRDGCGPAELGRAETLLSEWLRHRDVGDDNPRIGFALAPWGRRSKLIEGELKDIVEYIRSGMAEFPQDRPPHVQLYK